MAEGDDGGEFVPGFGSFEGVLRGVCGGVLRRE